MIEIKDLLAKYQNLLVSEGGRKEEVRKIISEIIRFDIPPEAMEIKNGTVYLNIRPIYKNEILVKKDLLDARLRESFGNKSPEDFR